MLTFRSVCQGLADAWIKVDKVNECKNALQVFFCLFCCKNAFQAPFICCLGTTARMPSRLPLVVCVVKRSFRRTHSIREHIPALQASFSGLCCKRVLQVFFYLLCCTSAKTPSGFRLFVVLSKCPQDPFICCDVRVQKCPPGFGVEGLGFV